MKPVDQEIVCAGRGDCLRAAIASILELELHAVPHFNLSGEKWGAVYNAFMWAHGWDFEGTRDGQVRPDQNPTLLPILPELSANGYFKATVKSNFFEGCFHAVVMDTNGVCVHDPSPSKHYQDVKIYGSPDLISWDQWTKV